MAAKLAKEHRVQSILSTLEMLNGDRKKRRRARKRSDSLRGQTLSSTLKTHDSLSGVKESRMLPKQVSSDITDKSEGKYSSFLAKAVKDSSKRINDNRQCHCERDRGAHRQVHADSFGVEQVDHERRAGKSGSVEDQHSSAARDALTLPDPSKSQDGNYISTPSHNHIDSESLISSKWGRAKEEIISGLVAEQEEEADEVFDPVPVPQNGVTKWQQIVNARLKHKPPSSISPAIREVVQSKVRSRRHRKSTIQSDSSISDRDEDHNALQGHISALQVINATLAFKRQKLRQIRETRKHHVSRLFRVVARLSIVVRRICAVHYVESGNEDRVNATFGRLLPYRQRTELMFDVTEYKAKRKWRLMPDTKRILQKPAIGRNEQDIQHIETALRDMSALGEYPATMQRSIARVGWYESYGPNRVLVREGHMPHAFYFILSGSALVTVAVPEEIKPKILAILLRGDSFGELAILNQSMRTSTVTSRESVEMFVISAEDFTKIVMSGNSKLLQEPGTVAFMRSIDFLREWPVRKITNNPKKCVFNFFRKDTVLVRDSKLSEWIYVVKSGSCSVFKQLKYVEPEINPTKQKSSKVDSRMTLSRHRQLLLDRERSFINRRLAAARAQRESLYKRGMDLPYLMMNEELTEGIAPTRNRSGTILQDEDGTEDIEEEKQEERWMAQLEVDGALTDMKERLYPLLETEQEDAADDAPRYGPQRTFAHDLNQRAMRKQATPKLVFEESPDDTRHVFVCIQTLQKGGVFGLVDVLFSEQPSLSLISNGAECMVMSKQFFLQHATDDMLHRIKISMMPYAKEDEIQRSLENQLQWEAYRSATMQKTLDRIQLKKFYTT